MSNIKSRIKKHVKIKASELVPHEMNPRVHPEEQREALQALYEEVGFARSLLAYELPDGRLKLIDGHLRQTMDPDMEVEVEVLDVNDEEARKLLLSIDPLAALATYDDECLNTLRELTQDSSDTLKAMWSMLNRQDKKTLSSIKARTGKQTIDEQFLVTITCEDEKHQVKLLRRFKAEGLECRAMTS